MYVYVKTMKGYAIIRNNRDYLLENIKPNNELISTLLSLNCITPKESHLIQGQHSDRDKNDELLNIMTSFDKDRLSIFMKCLRQTNQKTVARIIENGGGVIKIQVHSCRKKHTESMRTLQQLHKNIEDLRKKTIPWSHRMNRSISQLSDEGIEILNSQLDKQTVVVWIWCRSQAALEYMERLYESSQLRDIFFEAIQPFTSKIIDIKWNQFKKTIVVCEISANLTQRIKFPGKERERVRGVTKLQNEIYVLYSSDRNHPTKICVFEDQNTFCLRKEIETNEIKVPWDIGSSEKDNCVYVSDRWGKCVWKITREKDEKYKITKWLTTEYTPYTLSVSSDGQLLMTDGSSSILWIYGSDAELIRSIQLPNEIEYPRHAVKTSAGNFIISHDWKTGERKKKKLCSRSSVRDEKEDQKDKEEENEVGKNNKAKDKEEIEEKGNEMEENKEVYGIHDEENEEVEGTDKVDEMKEKKEKESESLSPWEKSVGVSVISELARDGQMVVHRFIYSNKIEELYGPRYLSLDSDDQVFVADSINDRVIFLDSDLNWNLFIHPAEDEDRDIHLPNSYSLCYDDENKQLFVVETFAINVYSINRI